MKSYLCRCKVTAIVHITLNAENDEEMKKLIKERGVNYDEEFDATEYYPRLDDAEFENDAEVMDFRVDETVEFD